MDLFDELDLLDSPTTDAITGDRVPRGQRCPDCGVPGYGPCGALNATSWRTDVGHLVVSHCDCGRYLWYDHQPRDWQAPGGLAEWERLTMLPDGTQFIEPLGLTYTPDLPPRPTERWAPGAGFPYRPKPGADDAAIARWQSRLARARAAQCDPESASGTAGFDQTRAVRQREHTSRTDGPHPAGP
ncbi:hypothetical protein [Promicromonospora soli]